MLYFHWVIHMNYIAIIGDAKDSKRKYDSKQLHQMMESGLEIINKKYSRHIAKVFGVSRGDDFQGLLHQAAPFCEIVDQLRAIFENTDFRFGIGYGILDTEINNPLSPFGSNGPVWWNANHMVEEIKKNHEKGIHHQTDSRIRGLNHLQVEQIINQNFIMMHQIRSSWTSQQRHIVYQMIINYGYHLDFKQNEAAERLGIDYKYFNKVLKATQYYNYIESMIAIQSYIQGGE
jgi:hypothetical protein